MFEVREDLASTFLKRYELLSKSTSFFKKHIPKLSENDDSRILLYRRFEVPVSVNKAKFTEDLVHRNETFFKNVSVMNNLEMQLLLTVANTSSCTLESVYNRVDLLKVVNSNTCKEYWLENIPEAAGFLTNERVPDGKLLTIRKQECLYRDKIYLQVFEKEKEYEFHMSEKLDFTVGDNSIILSTITGW